MKNFEMLLPQSIDDAVRALSDSNAGWSEAPARALAGGQDLVPEMKEHVVEPERVVNLKGAADLPSSVQVEGGACEIGALATLATVARDDALRRHFAVICEAAESVASAQIRTVATVGGNLCQRPRCWYYRNEHTVCLKKGGDECFSYEGMNKFNAILGGGPSFIVHPSDLAPALVACDARVHVRGPEAAEIEMPLERFYTLPTEGDVTRETRLEPDQLVTRVTIPSKQPGSPWRSTYLKFQEKESFDFALSAVALGLRMDGQVISEARLCLGGVAPVPWRCRSTEELLVGRRVDAETCALAAEDALRGAEVLSQNGYKIPLTKGLITKALEKLAEA